MNDLPQIKTQKWLMDQTWNAGHLHNEFSGIEYIWTATGGASFWLLGVAFSQQTAHNTGRFLLSLLMAINSIGTKTASHSFDRVEMGRQDVWQLLYCSVASMYYWTQNHLLTALKEN